jgi:hypothetical protein
MVALGNGLEVSPLGFGGMALTPVYGEVDPADAGGGPEPAAAGHRRH